LILSTGAMAVRENAPAAAPATASFHWARTTTSLSGFDDDDDDDSDDDGCDMIIKWQGCQDRLE